jgi:hypothetical protein
MGSERTAVPTRETIAAVQARIQREEERVRNELEPPTTFINPLHQKQQQEPLKAPPAKWPKLNLVSGQESNINDALASLIGPERVAVPTAQTTATVQARIQRDQERVRKERMSAVPSPELDPNPATTFINPLHQQQAHIPHTASSAKLPTQDLFAGGSEQQGRRPSMEDKSVMKLNYGGVYGQGFFAIYDGHSGEEVSLWLSQNLHLMLLNRLKIEPDVRMDVAFRDVFLEADKMILGSAIKDQGSVGVVSVVLKHVDASGNLKRMLYTANIGDARAVLRLVFRMGY